MDSATRMAVVNAIYRILLNRNADESGLAAYIKVLEQKSSLAEAIDHIAACITISGEYKKRVRNSEVAAASHRFMLSELPARFESAAPAAFSTAADGAAAVWDSKRDFLAALGLPPLELPDSEPEDPHPPPRAPQSAGADAPPMLALIATRSHLPFAEVAARTFLAHHPEFAAFLLLVDGTEEDRALIEPVTIVLLDQLGVEDIGWLAAKLDAGELSNALKPAFLQFLRSYGQRAIYLDCDIAVFARFTAMIAAMAHADLVLTPHMTALFPHPHEQWRHPNNADIFNSGLINAGGFGIDLAACESFLAFWREANLLHAWSADGARQTDQQFLNWALITCDNVFVLRDKTYNVAYWNLHERSLRRVSPTDPEPRFEVDGAPLSFFHFSGFDPNDTLRLSRHDQRYSVYTLSSIAVILEWYSGRVLASSLAFYGDVPYRFDALANGVRLNPFLRGILRRYEAYGPRADGMTQAGADAICAFLMRPLPATCSRLPLVAAVIYAQRPDLRSGYPDADIDLYPTGFLRWFLRHAGEEFEIEPLISRFRRVLDSDSLVGFAEEAYRWLGQKISALKLLGEDRDLAATELKLAGAPHLANTLLLGESEWGFFSDFSAVLVIYQNRADLQQIYPDPFGRSHASLLEWLRKHATEEHHLPPLGAELFADRSAPQVLARLFSILSRNEHLGALAVEDLLSDRPGRLIRSLLQCAGDGIEFTLADVEVLLFLHKNDRAQLVPLFLELPAIRRRALSSRTPEGRYSLLPGPSDAGWVAAGCKLHEACFSPFEVALEREIRLLGERMSSVERDVISVLRTEKLAASASGLTRIAEKRALLGLRGAEATALRAAPAAPRLRLNLFGYFFANTGVGESSRGLARALESFASVQTIPTFTGHLERSTRLEQLFAHYDHYADCNVFVSYPHAAEDLLGLLPAEMVERRRNIIHLAWEQSDWNTHWRAIYGRYDEIWTISEFAALSFRQMFGDEKRVRVVPNVLRVDDFPDTEAAAAARFTGPAFRFLFLFDANSSMERKNPEAVLEAFIAAFAGSKQAGGVALVFKINNLDRHEHAARVGRLRARAAASGLGVQFDGRLLSRAEVLRLIASVDCYVSLHRAEGFGYTMAEAMYLGLPVIASGYSGNLDYMSDENSFLVPCAETLVENADGPFQRGSVWGDPDIAAAAALMRRVVENPSEARRVGAMGAASVRRQLLADAVAERLKPAFGLGVPPRLVSIAEPAPRKQDDP